MRKYRTPLAAALFGALALGLAGPALAKHDGYGPSGHAWGHHKHHHHHEREVVYYAPPPVFVRPSPPMIVPQPVYYEPAYYYPPRRSPSVVIGVDIPLR